MNKPELITHIASQAGISKKAAEAALEAFVTTVKSALTGGRERIRISDLGTFRIVNLTARRGVNPRTGREMTIPAMSVPRFSPAKSLKRELSKKR
jgi:DNA-binding protein HU-beta